MLTEGTKTIVIPDITPGRESGKITFLRREKLFEPRSDAASKSEGSILDITE